MAQSPHARWKVAFFALAAFWVITTAYLSFQVVNLGALADDQGSAATSSGDALRVLATLLPTIAPSLQRADALALLRRQNPHAMIVATDSTVALDQLTFHFGSSGTIVSVVPAYEP